MKLRILSAILAVILAFTATSVTAFAIPATDVSGGTIDEIDPDYDDTDFDQDFYTVVIHYVYENGSEAAPDVTVNNRNDKTETVTSPTISGYTPDKESVDVSKDSDSEITVTYKTAPAPTPTPAPTPDQQGGNVTPAPGAGTDTTVPGELKAPALLKVKKAKKAKKAFTATWEKVDGATGYEVQYSLNKKFKKGKKFGTKIKKVKAAKANVTVKKLKKKKYFVRVRAVYGTEKSAWSNVKKIKVK